MRSAIERSGLPETRTFSMLVIISDLHLTDGTSGTTISSAAFEIFTERLQNLAFAAAHRADGSYRPIEQIDLVMLGDVLDVIRSSRWLDNSAVRPWDSPERRDFVDMVSRITTDILKQNEDSFSFLRKLAQDGGVAVPPATGDGAVAMTNERVTVPVKIHYMVGNHDWFYHLPGAAYDGLRGILIRHLGLANSYSRPFPHDPAESPELMEMMRKHRVFARHGDLYDPFNFEGDRNASSLGDAIVIELLNRFAIEIEREMGNDLPHATLMGLREIDNVRPLVLVPAWINGLLDRTCGFAPVRKQVKQVWDRLADRFLDLPFVRVRDTWRPNDLVDGLQRALKFSKQISIQGASHVLAWLHGLRCCDEASYFRHALAEQDFRNRRAKHIVYGHTHHAENVPLDASYAENYVLNQMYFNSGTWRRVHRQTEFAPAENEFIGSDVMTYLTFYQGDERRGRPYETWSGQLGVSANDVPKRRIDPPAPARAAAPAITQGIRGHAPHFNPVPNQAGIVPVRRV